MLPVSSCDCSWTFFFFTSSEEKKKAVPETWRRFFLWCFNTNEIFRGEYSHRPTCLTFARDVRVRDLQLSANIYLLLLVIIKWVFADLLQTLCQYYRVSGTGAFCHWSEVTVWFQATNRNASFPFRCDIHTQNLLKVSVHKGRNWNWNIESFLCLTKGDQ